MTLERSHDKARPTLPRSRDLPVIATDCKPSGERDARGRFTTSNAVANGRGWKSQIARMAGRELAGSAKELGQASWRAYLALLSDLPHDGPSVRMLAAAQARSAALSIRYAERAAELGLDTDAGRTALEMSVKLEQRVERLAITSLDIAARQATAARKNRVVDTHARMQDAFGAKRPHTVVDATPKPPEVPT